MLHTRLWMTVLMFSMRWQGRQDDQNRQCTGNVGTLRMVNLLRTGRSFIGFGQSCGWCIVPWFSGTVLDNELFHGLDLLFPVADDCHSSHDHLIAPNQVTWGKFDLPQSKCPHQYWEGYFFFPTALCVCLGAQTHASRRDSSFWHCCIQVASRFWVWQVSERLQLRWQSRLRL